MYAHDQPQWRFPLRTSPLQYHEPRQLHEVGLGVSYDACVTTAIMLKSKIGGKEISAYTMQCGKKVGKEGYN